MNFGCSSQSVFLTRKRRFSFLLLSAIILFSFGIIMGLTAGKASAEELPAMWWEETNFIPLHQSIRGIPIQNIDSSWRLASEFQKLDSALIKGGRDIMKEYGLSFLLQEDFNRDGFEDLVTVGVYEDNKGVRGNFVLVLSKDIKGIWGKAFLAAWPVKPHFLGLVEKKGRIEVWYCIDCDNGGELVWDNRAKTYSFHSFWGNN